MNNKIERYYNEKGELGVLIGKSIRDYLNLDSPEAFIFGYANGDGDFNLNIDKRIIEYYLTNPSVEEFMNYIIDKLNYQNSDSAINCILRTCSCGYSKIELNDIVLTDECEEKRFKNLRIQEILELKFVKKGIFFTIMTEPEFGCECIEYEWQHICKFGNKDIVKA